MLFPRCLCSLDLLQMCAMHTKFGSCTITSLLQTCTVTTVTLESSWASSPFGSLHTINVQMSQRRVKVHCAIWLLWMKVDVILHVLISKLCTKKFSPQCASYRFSRERSMTSVKHAWQFIGEIKGLKCLFISPNLRYLHSPLYFLFWNFYWGALKISQLPFLSLRSMKKTSMTTLPELSQLYGRLVPTILGHQA